MARRTGRAGTGYGTVGTGPQGQAEGFVQRARTRRQGENGFPSVRRSGEDGGTNALAAEPTMAGASGTPGEIFGSAD